MQLETLRFQNFCGYEDQTFRLHPQFNLIIGENGAGKTSFLEGAAVAIGSWLLGFPGQDSRNIRPKDVRITRNDSGIGLPQYPVRIESTGYFQNEEACKWTRSTERDGGSTTRKDANQLKKIADRARESVLKQNPEVLPLIRYFGAGRLWESVRDTDGNALAKYKGMQPAELAKHSKKVDKILFNNEFSSPFYGYRMSVDKRCNSQDLIRWMASERNIELDEEDSSIALRLVYKAIESMMPEIKSARYSIRLKELVLHLRNDGQRRTFDELSDGNRNIVAMAADLAIKAVMLNPHLGDNALELIPGVVLIDELDLHLHPRWQRRVIKDLRRTFPKIQFICTTHSPQLIGQVKPEEMIILGRDSDCPSQSLGMDSNWVLRHLMGSDDRDPEVAKELDAIFEDIEEGNFENAQEKVDKLRVKIGEHPELVEADSLINRYTILSDSIVD